MSLVLIVDDDGDQRALYTTLLEEMGHEVMGAPDGLVALELACERSPTLVLTDWRMPRMDGIELCKAFRRNLLLRDTPIILHSSSTVPEPWHADLCLRKRGDPALVRDAVEAVLAAPSALSNIRVRGIRPVPLALAQSPHG